MNPNCHLEHRICCDFLELFQSWKGLGITENGALGLNGVLWLDKPVPRFFRVLKQTSCSSGNEHQAQVLRVYRASLMRRPTPVVQSIFPNSLFPLLMGLFRNMHPFLSLLSLKDNSPPFPLFLIFYTLLPILPRPSPLLFSSFYVLSLFLSPSTMELSQDPFPTGRCLSYHSASMGFN